MDFMFFNVTDRMVTGIPASVIGEELFWFVCDNLIVEFGDVLDFVITPLFQRGDGSFFGAEALYNNA